RHRRVMMKAAPAPHFVISQSDRFEVFVITFDRPTPFGGVDKLSQRRLKVGSARRAALLLIPRSGSNRSARLRAILDVRFNFSFISSIESNGERSSTTMQIEIKTYLEQRLDDLTNVVTSKNNRRESSHGFSLVVLCPNRL